MDEVPGIDPSALAQLHGIGGSEFVHKMIDLFLEEAPQRIAAARKGQQSGSFEEIAAASHSLKSSAHPFGATKLSRIAEKVERLADSRQMDEIPELLSELEKCYPAVEAWLEAQR